MIHAIAQLIGARRPTVSTALNQLTNSGQLARRLDGGWMLRGKPVGVPTTEVRRIVALRRRRVPAGMPVEPMTWP